MRIFAGRLTFGFVALMAVLATAVAAATAPRRISAATRAAAAGIVAAAATPEIPNPAAAKKSPGKPRKKTP